MAEKQDVPLITETENEEKKQDEEVQDSESDESEEEEDGSEEEDLFEVERIISRKKRNGVYLYRVRWKGYSPSSDTWEPQENLDIVADMVREFDAQQDKKAKSRQEERRLRKLRMEGKKLPGEESSDDDTDSSKEESQLCETTRFFKRLEKDKDLVWTQPDLYSKVKSRSSSLVSKKQEEKVEEPTAPASTVAKAPPVQSESKRGRGRPRGGGTPRGKGTGRGRGRPPKKTAGRSSDEGEGGGDSSQPKSSGKGRPRKKPEKDSSLDSLSDDSSLESDDSKTAGDTGAKEDSAKTEDTSASAPAPDLDSSKKPNRDTSEETKDSEEPVPAKKTPGKPRGRPPKKAATENHKDKDSEKSTPATKGAGRGRGRPPKIARDASEDSDADPDKPKGKGRGRGRPKKKTVEGTSEDHDSLDKSAAPAKTKGKGKGRPKKSVKYISDDSEDSDDSAVPEKSSTDLQSQKLTNENSEENEPLAVPAKKKGKGPGRPRKNVIIDTSEDNESDSAASLAKNSPVVEDMSKMSVITEHSDENNSGDDLKSRKNEKQENEFHKLLENKASSQDAEESVSASKPKSASKAKSKARKRLKMEDSEDGVSDDSSAQKATSEPPRTEEESKRKKNKDTKSKKDPKSKKQNSSSKDSTAKKSSAKLGKVSPADVSKVEQTVLPSATPQEPETKSDPAVVDSRTTTEKAERESPLSSFIADKVSSEQSSKMTVATTSARSKAETVIPVLEKFAMESVTDSFALEADDKGSEESKAAAVSGIKEEKPAPKSSQKKVLNNNKESKEATVSQKKNLSKGLQKSVKRKLDTAVKHAMAVQEGEASPVKVASLKPPNSPTPAPVPPQFLPDTHSTASPERPSSPIETSAKASDPSLTANASSKSGVALTESAVEDSKPVSSPVTQKVSSEGKVKSSKSKAKAESSKSHKTGPKSKSSTKSEKQKSDKEGKSTDKNVKTAVHSTAQLPSFEGSFPGSVSVANVASDAVKTTVQNKELSAKSASVASEVQNTSKPDASVLKPVKSDTSESKLTKTDAVSAGMTKPQTVDKTNTAADQTDPKSALAEADDLKRKFSFSSDLSTSLTTDAGKQSMCRTSSTSDLNAPMSSGAGKQSIFRSGSTSELSSSLSSGLGRHSLYSLSASSPGRSTPTPGRDSLISTPSKDTSGVFSSPGVSRDMSSLYPYSRDYSVRGRSGSWGSASPRDQSQLSASPKDPQLGVGACRDLPSPSLNRDFPALSRDGSSPLGVGYSFLGSLSSRPGYSRDLFSFASSRQDFNANIASKDLADKLYSPKSLYRSSSLPSAEGERPKPLRGMDQDLGEALRNIDLEYVEKLVLPPITPMELSHNELRQAVINGNCYLVERALVSKRYDVDLPDNKGYTLLMNAVVGGYDDIIIHLLTHGANAEVQVKGNTALMLAVEQAECSTVYMLLEMGAHVNTADNNGETALFKAVRRGDKQILKLVLEHGADFNWTSQAQLTALQTAKQYRLADIDATLTDHIHRVVETFEEEVRRVMGGAARLVSCLFPHRCVSLRDTETFTISFEYQPTLPSGPSRGCLLFIAHARFDPEVRCRLYGQCAVRKVTMNGVDQLCITEEPNFVMVFHPLITGWNELVVNTQKDPMSKAKLIVCAYNTELIR